MSKEEILFFKENLHYFDNKNKLIRLEDSTKTFYVVFFVVGSIFFIAGLVVFYTSDTWGGIFFIFISLLPLLVALYLYMSYQKYKNIPLVLYKKSSKIGEVLRGYVVINMPVKNKKYQISLQNIYSVKKVFEEIIAQLRIVIRIRFGKIKRKDMLRLKKIKLIYILVYLLLRRIPNQQKQVCKGVLLLLKL